VAEKRELSLTKIFSALMVSRPPENTNEVKTNLIIAPVALLRQWEREIRVRLKDRHQMKVYVHHSSSKTMYKTWDKFKEFDVVITTYGLISREYKEHFALGIESADTESSSSTNGNRPDRYKQSPFFNGKWHRVILDEAQFIKNKLTLSAKSCCALDAEYRWCLSGTPMQNKVEELYSLIKFLRIKPYNDEKKFTQDIGSGIKKGTSDQSIQKLRVLLQVILLRRTKSTEIDGRPILQLPPRIVEFKQNVFDAEEKEYYDMLEHKTATQMNKYLKSDSINKNYSSILVLLLRLRQACCHPKLIELSELKAKEKQAKEASPNALKAARSLDANVVRRIKEETSFVCPICYDGFEAEGILLTTCGHVICAECSPGFFAQSRRRQMDEGEDGKSNSAKCSLCKSEIFEDQLIDYETFDLVHNQNKTDSEIVSMRRKEKKKLNEEKKRIQEAIKVRREALANKELCKSEVLNELFSDSDNDGDEDFGADVDWDDDKLIVQQLGLEKLFPDGWISATKITKCMELVKDIQRDYPGEKIIIFSQFTSLLDLLNVPLVRDGYDYLRYDGSMNATERNETVLEFFDNPEKLLMLVSLKAGNVGLTLTCASHVILMDPFWNPYVEEQAIDRAHRIGQERPVYVHRLVISDTVEDRILTLQDEKRRMIDAALEEGGPSAGNGLDRNQLLYLFGLRQRPS
jgi:SNF2 family DNA or RNA helicase